MEAWHAWLDSQRLPCITSVKLACESTQIKPENCLIEKNGYLKLCNFGIAKQLPSTVHLLNGQTEVVSLAFTMCGTPEFITPEFVLSTGYDREVDVWALGCILVELYNSHSPFEFDGNFKKTFKEVCLIGMGRKELCVPEALKKDALEMAADFASQLLTAAKSRIWKEDSSKMKSHKYFKSMNFDHLQTRQIIYLMHLMFPNLTRMLKEHQRRRQYNTMETMNGAKILKGNVCNVYHYVTPTSCLFQLSFFLLLLMRRPFLLSFC